MWPTVYIAVVKQGEPWYWLWGWTGLVTGVSILIELYLLFVIALKAVHEVSELINMRALEREAASYKLQGARKGGEDERGLEGKGRGYRGRGYDCRRRGCRGTDDGDRRALKRVQREEIDDLLASGPFASITNILVAGCAGAA